MSSSAGADERLEAGALVGTVATESVDLSIREPMVGVVLVPVPQIQADGSIRLDLKVSTPCTAFDADGEMGTGSRFKYRTEAVTTVRLADGSESFEIGGILRSRRAAINKRGALRFEPEIEISLDELLPKLEAGFEDALLRIDVAFRFLSGQLEPGMAVECLALTSMGPSEDRQRLGSGASGARWSPLAGSLRSPFPAATAAADGTLAHTTAWNAVQAFDRTNLKKLAPLATVVRITDSHLGEDGNSLGYSSACASIEADASAGTGRKLRYAYELSGSTSDGSGARVAEELLLERNERIDKFGEDSRTRRLPKIARTIGAFLGEAPREPTHHDLTESYAFKGHLLAGQTLLCATQITALPPPEASP